MKKISTKELPYFETLLPKFILENEAVIERCKAFMTECYQYNTNFHRETNNSEQFLREKIYQYCHYKNL